MLLVLALDLVSFRIAEPWDLLAAQMELDEVELPWEASKAPLFRGLVQDRRRLAALERDPPEGPLVFLLGTSRAERAFRPEVVAKRMPPGMRWVVIAHRRFFVMEIRGAVAQLLRHRPQAVVLGLSEVDTHSRLDLDDRSSMRSLRVWTEAAALLGPRFLWDRRTHYLRVALGDVLALYRMRGALGEAGLDALRRFEALSPSETDGGSRIPAEGHEAAWIYAQALTAEGVAGPGTIRQRHKAFLKQTPLTQVLKRGSEQGVQQELLRRTVADFRDAGVRVVIVELPIYESGRSLYDPAFRLDFLEFVASLQRDYDVEFLPLEQQQEYRASDFVDLIHLDEPAARRIGESTLEVLQRTLPAGQALQGRAVAETSPRRGVRQPGIRRARPAAEPQTGAGFRAAF